jgi:hypothetical protein
MGMREQKKRCIMKDLILRVGLPKAAVLGHGK